MKQQSQERGVIAIFLSIIIGMLLLTTTTFAARVSVNELSQSSTVDRSEAAYYAAEAGIEEAIRRIDNNPHATTCQMFPEQFYSVAPSAYPTTATCPSAQPGDAFQVTDGGGNGFTQARPVFDSGLPTEYGQVSWRHRKVYTQSTYYSGTQAKDDTIQFDTSELRRRCVGVGNEVGGQSTSYKDCDGSTSIYQNFRGLKYCWDAGTNPNVKIEVTTVSFLSNYTGFVTEKTILDHSTFPSRTYENFTSAGGNCTNINVTSPTGRRYIFRIKPIFTGATFNNPTDAQQYRFTVQYNANIIEQPVVAPGQRLYIPDDTYLIDVVGQSGDVQRRLVAKKERTGRLIGIFDYVLYSGDPTKDLCKTGVNTDFTSYDPNTCSVISTVAVPSGNTLTYNNRTDASLTQRADNGCNASIVDSSSATGNALEMCSNVDVFTYNYTYSGPAGSPSKFIVDARQDIDTGAPGPAQIQFVITAPGGSITHVVNATGKSYAQYPFDISSLNIRDGDAVTVSIQMLTDSCTGCSQGARPADTDLNGYVDYFGLTNNSSL